MNTLNATRMGKGRRGPWVLLVGAICLWCFWPGPALSQEADEPPGPAQAATPVEAADDAVQAPEAADETAGSSPETGSGVPAGTGGKPKDPRTYDLWVLAPAVVAIILAILTRQVIPSLVVGVFVAAAMLIPTLAPDHPYADLSALIGVFRLACETYILDAIVDSADGYAHAKIIMFTLLIGFTVGVMARNGGTEGMVRLVAGKTESRRRGALTAWLSGLVVFFDDYANTMIVGPTMRPVFDKLKLSRAKLAYIVDSTAAPVASIALIGTWVGAEIGFIQTGLDQVAATGAPLMDADNNVLSGMQVFISSIAYRFYPLLALFLVFLVAVTGRDFGPMRKSEGRALSRVEFDRPRHLAAPPVEVRAKPKWWLGLIPLLVLVGATIAVLIVTGLRAEGTVEAMNATLADGSRAWAELPAWRKASTIVSNSDAYLSILYGAVLAAIVVMLLTVIARTCSTREATEAGTDGMSRMFPAIVILILAWALSSSLQDLKLGEVARDHLEAMQFPAQWLPLSVFLCAALISFATGTSWGTLGILCPVTVTIGAQLIVPLDPAVGMSIFYAAVGSVLAGAVFGDHCSPISDTTVLSSVASDCPHEEHVWTQIPYALAAAIGAMGLGDVLCSVYNQPWYYGLGAGAAFLLLVVFIIGRRPSRSLEYATT